MSLPRSMSPLINAYGAWRIARLVGKRPLRDSEMFARRMQANDSNSTRKIRIDFRETIALLPWTESRACDAGVFVGESLRSVAEHLSY